MTHLLRDFLSKTKIFLIAIPLFYQYKLFKNNRRRTDKAILIQLKHNYFKRYLYVLIKFLYLEGYTIYIKPNLTGFYNLRTEQFGSYLFSEKIIRVGRAPKNIEIVVLDESAVSADYFDESKSDDEFSAGYHVPMSQHPIMYKEGWWNATIVGAKRKHSLFMAGNFDEGTYTSIEKDGIFKTLSRLRLHSFLLNKHLLYPINSLQNLHNFYASAIDHKIILINRLKINVPMDELRHWLAKFDFYFALPGVIMPFSHNIIEAMSVGCIPFLQQSYADMFKPPLVNHKQVFTFTDLSDLEIKIEYLMGLDSSKIELMRNEVNTYYGSFLTPNKVVASLINVNFKNIYLQAEDYSVALLKKTKNL